MARRFTGGCQCGAVRYAFTAEDVAASICHCRMCQKAFAAPFGALGSVLPEALTWTRGAPSIFRSSTAAERGFCARCGTPLTFRYHHLDVIEIALVTLDDPNAIAPSKEVGAEGRLSWLRTAVCGGLPERTTERPNMPEQVRTLVNFQHPDHDTPDGWAPPAAET
jgi:hypothetical protein